MAVSSDPIGIDPSDPVIARLLERCTFPAMGTAVVCGVSGGADSTALLALAVAAGLVVEAAHVDHGLRHDSSTDGHHVARLASAWGAAFRSVSVVVEPGPNLEERARRARHRALGPAALVGHTADDQAETVLIRLLRGTGPAGLAAMSPDRHPILGLRRTETRALCRHLGVTPIDDPSNADDRFVRNRVRHEVLPLLENVAGRDVVPLLARLADLAAEQVDLIDDLASHIDPTDSHELKGVHGVVASRALRSWWMSETGNDHPPDSAALDRMLDVVRGGSVGCDVTDGWSLRRTAGRLRLVPPADAPPRHG